jgi:molybdopterin-guanine dinucleotide biosynthesis protein A
MPVPERAGEVPDASRAKPRWYHFCVKRAGYVLVGGRSSRMGRDKALLPCRGELLVQAVAGVVAEAAVSAVLVGDPERYGGLGYPVIPDETPGEGPLGGIMTALRHTRADLNLVTACDMPALSAGFLGGLLAAAEANGAAATLPAGPSGRLEPLCAVYRRDALRHIEAAFHGGIRKVTAALEGLPLEVYSIAEVEPFQNVNTPEEWAGYVRK